MSWVIEATDQFTRDLKKLSKNQAGEHLAVMRNLQIYFDSHGNSPKPSLIQHGFLHIEPTGIRAIDQTGGALPDGTKRQKMKETRLYTYSDLQSKKLHLLCIGDKQSQPKDIQFSKKQVEEIRKASSQENEQ